MSEPTEGPWSAPPGGAYGQWPVLGPNFEAIAFATAQPGDRWKAAANARLMAAARDMEKALEVALADGGLRYWTRPILEAALAKARGSKVREVRQANIAPDMKEALEYVLSKSTIDMDDAMIDVVTAALAKAKGEANA